MSEIIWSEVWEKLSAGAPAPELPPEFKLPVLPLAVSQFNQESQNPKTTNAKLAGIIESDSGLTCDVLQFVNSTEHGIRAKIGSVKHAIAMLGVPKLKLTVMTSALNKAISSRKSKLINIKQFSLDALQRAIFARQIAPLFQCDAEVAFSLGLLQDILLPVLTNDLYDKYIAFWDDQRHSATTLSSFELQTFGWTHAQATAYILKQWEFPDELVCAVFHHHKGLKMMMDPQLGRSLCGLAAVSGLMPGTVAQDPDGLGQLQKLDGIWAQLNLKQIAEQTEQEFLSQAPQSNIPTLNRRLEKLIKQAEAQLT